MNTKFFEEDSQTFKNLSEKIQITKEKYSSLKNNDNTQKEETLTLLDEEIALINVRIKNNSSLGS